MRARAVVASVAAAANRPPRPDCWESYSSSPSTSSMSTSLTVTDAEHKEVEAFIAFFRTFELATPVNVIEDLCDGSILFQVLCLADPSYFSSSTTRPAPPASDNWVLCFSFLKRLYRLMTQYFVDVLHNSTAGLQVPDLQAMAKNQEIFATLSMCRLTIAIGVQCEKNKDIIDRIRGLAETDQHTLMRAIEQIVKVSAPSGQSAGEASMTEDDHYYQIQSDRSNLLSEKETLEKVYQTLLEEHRTLQTSYDDMLSEKEDIAAQLREARLDAESGRRSDKPDIALRAEIDRLRSDLQKSEDNLAMAESEIEKQTSHISDLARKIEELQVQADQAVKLKDQVDELRHATDKLQKNENVMEKYKKKLQEGAELRQRLKSLEKQNADLVDKNASLEEEYRRVAGFKPLMESYKNQIADLETKNSSRSQENDKLQYELDQTRTKLKIMTEERAKDSETLELYQERVRELELASHRPVPKPVRNIPASESEPSVPTSVADALQQEVPAQEEEEEEEDEEADMDQGLGGELDDAITGTTMTDLKLQIRKLKRELESGKQNSADASRVLVLENLLEDANRMKSRYEADYLAAHREKLVLQSNLEEIRSGKSMGDGTEAAIALRQRLNETVEQLDQLRKEHAELSVKYDSQAQELTVAKSDLHLVNKDQLDILAQLRESVNEDKAGLESEVAQLQDQIKELGDKNKMQLEQINALLLEKVSLQSEGIDQRERALQRERDLGDLRASLSGKDIPEDIKTRLLSLHEDNVNFKEQNKTLSEKLAKARQFIKNQDKLFKEEQAKLGRTLPEGVLDEAAASFKSQIKILEDEVARHKRTLMDMTKRYNREQELMLSAIHSLSMQVTRSHLGPSRSGTQPVSWLAQQRKQAARIERQVL